MNDFSKYIIWKVCKVWSDFLLTIYLHVNILKAKNTFKYFYVVNYEIRI